jgi:hypothetical protein
MMDALVSPDGRIRLAASPAGAAPPPELEAVFVGSAASSPAFAAASLALAAAAQLGFVPVAGDTSLTLLPLAFSDFAAFGAAFPGDTGWLACAVRDYFAAGGLRAWVVRVDADPAAMLDATLNALPPAGPLAIAAQIPSAGLLLLPDLEQACLEAALPPPAAPAPLPAAPGFRPLADFIPAGRQAPALPPPGPAVSPFDVLTRVSRALGVLRPDMLCLFALPVGADPTQAQPALVQRAIGYLYGDPANPGPDLPQVQAIAPLVRDVTGTIASPAGLIAGLLCATAQGPGVWRSVAGRTLACGVTPLRRIESRALAQLRAAGITALRFVQGGTILDGDILACLQARAGSAPRRAAGTRRLMGWLLRQLRSFGEQLVFENVLDDGRVELVLTSLFAALFQRGALAGGQVSDAVRITRRDLGARNTYGFDIAVATALAVETIQLQFLDGTLTTTLAAA